MLNIIFHCECATPLRVKKSETVSKPEYAQTSLQLWELVCLPFKLKIQSNQIH